MAKGGALAVKLADLMDDGLVVDLAPEHFGVEELLPCRASLRDAGGLHLPHEECRVISLRILQDLDLERFR